VQNFEPSGEALGQALLDEKRSRAEQYHLERAPGSRILVPEALDGFGPPDGLLHLVEHEDGALTTGDQARSFPLLGDPLGTAQGRLVRAGEPERQPGGAGHLLHQGGLAHLPRAGHDLDEPTGLGQTPGELGGVGTPKGSGGFAHHSE